MKKKEIQNKDLTFLKEYIICNKGIYDKKTIMENTLEAFGKCIDNNYLILTNLIILKDKTIIVFDPTKVKELLLVEEKLEKMTYDEIEYITKYHVPTLEEVLKYVDGYVPFIFRLNEKYKWHKFDKLFEILSNYKGLYTIESYRTEVVKYITKKHPEVICGALLNEQNYKKIYDIRNVDYLDINVDLMNEKIVKKQKEDIVIIGNNIKKIDEFKAKSNFYDNLVCDRLLEKKN
jgi:hypothetical protein